MRALKYGDTFVIWKLDRAFRSTVEAILKLEELRQKGITLKIITINIDTSTPEVRVDGEVVALARDAAE